MKKINLTGKYGVGKFALIDNGDFEAVNKFRWYLNGKYPAKSFGKRPNRNKILLHTFLINTPKGMMVDHIDGNELNNQRKNLRICTHAQNVMNSKKSIRNKGSKYKGVFFVGWRAYIGRRIIGNFPTEIEAAEAYNTAAKGLYKDFARLNIID